MNIPYEQWDSLRRKAYPDGIHAHHETWDSLDRSGKTVANWTPGTSLCWIHKKDPDHQPDYLRHPGPRCKGTGDGKR